MLGPRAEDTIRRASAACAGVDPEAEMPDRPPPGLTWNVTCALPGTKAGVAWRMPAKRRGDMGKTRRLRCARIPGLSLRRAVAPARLRLLTLLRALDLLLLDLLLDLVDVFLLGRQGHGVWRHHHRRRKRDVRLLDRFGRRRVVGLGDFLLLEEVAFRHEVHADRVERYRPLASPNRQVCRRP